MENKLITNNLIAIQTLMSETIFSIEKEVTSVSNPENTTIETPQDEQNSIEEFIYQGDKSTGVLFILRYPDFPYFSPEAADAFSKTIGAMQLTTDNVAVMNLANPHNPPVWKRIMDFFQPKKIILLGVDPQSLQLPAIAHNSYLKGRIATVFHTFSFEEMFADVEKKKLFWGEFKVFIVS